MRRVSRYYEGAPDRKIPEIARLKTYTVYFLEKRQYVIRLIAAKFHAEFYIKWRNTKIK